MEKWTHDRIDILAFDFLSWYDNNNEKTQMPEALKAEVMEFAQWMLDQHKNGVTSETARKALRIFNIRMDA